MSYTDLSGYIFKKLHDITKKINRQIIRGAAKVFGAEIVQPAGNILSGFCGPAQSACAAYWNYEFTRAMGGSLSQAFKAGVTAAITAEINSAFKFDSRLGQAVFDGVVGGIAADVNGGNFGNGFWSAGLNSAVGGGNVSNNTYINVATSAIISGTISAVTGGKFKNGAYSAAFASAMRQDWGSSSINRRASSGKAVSPSANDGNTKKRYQITSKDGNKTIILKVANGLPDIITGLDQNFASIKDLLLSEFQDGIYIIDVNANSNLKDAGIFDSKRNGRIDINTSTSGVGDSLLVLGHEIIHYGDWYNNKNSWSQYHTQTELNAFNWEKTHYKSFLQPSRHSDYECDINRNLRKVKNGTY